MRLYSMPSSGNSYKVRLLLALTRREARIVDCENGSERLEQLKADGRLPYGKVPVLALNDGRLLGESCAIMWYLGEGTEYIPSDALERAQMLGWMFWEQYNHEPVIAVRQSLLNYPSKAAEATPERLAELLERGHSLLHLMDDNLTGRHWLVGDQASLADLCLYAYTHNAGSRGGYDMERFPAVNAWLRRVEELPGYVRLEG